MTNSLKISLAARCEAAGRSENEDNFQVAEDLSVSNVTFTTDKVLPIGNKGTLLLVCDGMGGMNAGEVAAAIGVETIKSMFSSNMLTDDVMCDDNSVAAYIRKAIAAADSKIKQEASADSAKQGMGCTVVLAWVLRNKVYVGWCGDSRAYRYNPACGLEQLSHDHSYVQDLVDAGRLSPDLAFDYPNKNIITRSLGDPRGAARPDVRVYELNDGDVILLCSDGLSDALRDSQIEASLQRGGASVSACRDALWEDSYRAGWHDNVTIVLARVAYNFAELVKDDIEPVQVTISDSMKTAGPSALPVKRKLSSKVIAIAVLSVILIVVVALLAVLKPFSPKEFPDPKVESAIKTVDSLLENDCLKKYDSTTYDELVRAYQQVPNTCSKKENWNCEIKRQGQQAALRNEGDDIQVKKYLEKIGISIQPK